MSAPMKLSILRKIPKLFHFIQRNTEPCGVHTKYMLPSIRYFAINHKICQINCTYHGNKSLSTTTNSSPFQKKPNSRNLHENRIFHNVNRSFSTCPVNYQHVDQDEDNTPRNMLKLMDFPPNGWLMLPNPFKLFKNKIMMFLIHNFIDQDFTTKNFLTGAQQAIVGVSSLISQGRFDELNGLVEARAIPEIHHNYAKLDVGRRQIISIRPNDITLQFIYEIGMIFDKNTSDDLAIEVTTVLHCNPAQHEDPQPSMMELNKTLSICNYRFIRAYNKKFTPLTDWTINKLNHFKPIDLQQQNL